MEKFVNGRSGQLTPEYQEAYDHLSIAFARIADNRMPHFTRVLDIFQPALVEAYRNNEYRILTLGISDVTRLAAEKQRTLLKHLLIQEKMNYTRYQEVCNLVSGGSTHSEALNLLLMYMGSKYYWRDRYHKVQNIQQWALSWIGRYSSGDSDGAQYYKNPYPPSGVVVDYKIEAGENYCCSFLVRTSTGRLDWQHKEMTKVERDRIKSRTIISTNCANCHNVRTDIVVSKAYLAQHGLPIGYQYCTECGQKSCSIM